MLSTGELLHSRKTCETKSHSSFTCCRVSPCLIVSPSPAHKGSLLQPTLHSQLSTPFHLIAAVTVALGAMQCNADYRIGKFFRVLDPTFTPSESRMAATGSDEGVFAADGDYVVVPLALVGSVDDGKFVAAPAAVEDEAEVEEE